MSVLDLVAKITLDTTEYDKGLDNSKSKAGSFGESIKSGFGKVAGLATKAIAGASAAVVGFGATSVKTGMTFDSAMSQVAATMGKSMSDMENEVGTVDLAWGTFSGNLRDYAQEMGAHTAFSATQAAEALNYMALAGYDTNESMAMLPNVLNLAAAGAMDLGTASDMVTDAQSALGLTMAETNTFVDQMAKTSATTNTSVSQLGSAILTIGATARSVKGGTAELNQVLGIMADNSIKGAEGGTHLRNMILSLQTPTKDGTEALAALGLSYADMYDEAGNLRALPEIFQDMSARMEGMTQQSKDAIVSGLFNKTDLKAVNALLNTNKDRWDEVAGAISQAQGAAEQMAATQLDNLAGDITLFKSALEGAQIAVSDNLSPAFRGFVQEGSAGLTEFTEKLKAGDLSGAIQAIGNTLAGLATEVVKMVPDMVKAGTQLLAGVGRGLAENFPVLMQSAQELVVFLYNSIAENAPQIIEGGAQLLFNIAQGIGDNLPEIMNRATSLVVYLAESLVAQAPTLLQAGANMLGGLIQGLMENLPKLAESAIRMIGFFASGLAQGIPQLLAQALPMIESFTGMLRENAGKIVDAGMNLILNLAQGIANSIPTLVEHIPQIVINIAGIINDNMPKILATGLKVIVTLVKGIISAIPVIVANIPKILEAIISVIMAVNWLKLGGNIIKSIVDGVKSVASSLPDIFHTTMKSVWDFITGIDWLHLGSGILETIGQGILSIVTNIPSFIGGIAQSAFNTVAAIDWLQIGATILEGIVGGLSGLGDAIAHPIESAGNFIKGIFGGAKDDASASMAEMGTNIANSTQETTANLDSIWKTSNENLGLTFGEMSTNTTSIFGDMNNNLLTNAGETGTGLDSIFGSTATDASSIFGSMSADTTSIFGDMSNQTSSIFGDMSMDASSTFGSMSDDIYYSADQTGADVSNIFGNMAGDTSGTFDGMNRDTTGIMKAQQQAIAANAMASKDAANAQFGAMLQSTIRTFMEMQKQTMQMMQKSLTETVNAMQGMQRSAQFTWSLPILGTSTIGDATNIVSDAVDIMKRAFDFNWSLPDIQIPHISVNWENLGFGVQIPNISVDWWAKGYDNPYLLTEPTVLSGFGDRGTRNGGEIVYSHDKLMEDISKAKGGTFAPVINVYTQEGQSNEAIAQYVMDKLTRQYQRAARYV